MGGLHSQLQKAVSCAPLNFGYWQPQGKVQQFLKDLLVSQRLFGRLERLTERVDADSCHLHRLLCVLGKTHLMERRMLRNFAPIKILLVVSVLAMPLCPTPVKAAPALRLLREINPSGAGVLYTFHATPSYLLFWGYDGATANVGNPWRSDGTSSGTVQIKGISGSNSELQPFLMGGDLGTVQVFEYNDGLGDGSQLWRTDGTSAGTYKITSNLPSTRVDYRGFFPLGNKVFFSSNAGCNNADSERFCFWSTNGSSASVALPDSLVDLADDATILQNFVFLGQPAYTQYGEGMYVSDGTAAGSIQLYPSTVVGEIEAVNDKLFFVASDVAHGEELWISDLTAPGTHLLVDINAGSANSSPQSLTRVGDSLYFTALDSTHGRELWKSDGTAAGTVRISDIGAAIADANIYSLQAFKPANGPAKAFFFASDGVHGLEPWISDGTSAGTHMLADLNPGAADSGYAENSYAVMSANRLYFTITDATNRLRLASTDGTSAGTSVVDATTLAIDVLGVVGKTLFVKGQNDQTNGDELFGLDTFVAENQAASSTVVCSHTEKTIADLQSVSTSLTIPARGTITKMQYVSVDLVHTYMGDVSLTLTHNDTGRSVTLMNRPSHGMCKGHIADMYFADATIGRPADINCADTHDAFSLNGSYLPTQAISAFQGELAKGQWTLSVKDNAAGDSGTLHQWCLSASDDEIFTDSFE